MGQKSQETSGKGQLIQFTKDMGDTLTEYFERYASEGVVNLESNKMGLWLINPINSTRQFLGKATLDGESTIRTGATKDCNGGNVARG